MAISEKRTQIYLPYTLFGDLRKEARLEKKSIAQTIREAIQIYLEERKVQKMDWKNDSLNRIVGRGKADKDLAANHDRYIYGS